VARRVLITRAAEDAAPLASTLARLGYDPVVVPLLERRWHVDAVVRLARDHPAADAVLVTSGVVASVVATAAPSAWADALWVAVGPSTRRRLEQVGLPCHLVPEPHTAAAMVEALTRRLGERTAGAEIVYPRADLASPETARALEARGASVVDVVAYTNRAPPGSHDALREALPVDATPMLSGSAARRVAAALDGASPEVLGKVVAIGPSTARAAREAGLTVHSEANPHNLQGLVLALHATLPPSQPMS